MNNNICQVKQDILVTLDTRNCTTFYNSDKFSDVEWDLSDVIKKPNKAAEFSVSVINANIPIGQYNVVPTDNTGLVITIQTLGGSPFTIGITDAHYTINSLLSTITGNLSAPYTIVYLDYRNRVYISNGSGNQFTFKVSTGLAEPLGFEPNKTYSSTSGTISAPYCVNMSGLRSINVHLDNLNTKNISSFTKSTSTIIANVPVDVNSMGIVSYNLSCDYEIPVPISSMDFINIMLRDNQNNLIQNNGIHWSVTLKFSYYIQQEFSTETLHEKVNRQKLTIVQPRPMITEMPKIFSSRNDEKL